MRKISSLLAIWAVMIMAMPTFANTRLQDDLITIGKPGSTANKRIKLGSQEIRSNTATSKLEYTHDGVTYKPIGSGSGAGGSSGGINLIANESFEDPITTGWSNTGGTLTQESYLNGTETDAKFARFVATAAGQYFETPLITVPTNFSGGCQADFKKISVSADDLFKLEILDSSSNVLASSNIKKSSWVKFPTINTTCPTPGSQFRLRVTSLAAGTIDSDYGYLGSNQNLVNVSQAMLVFKGNFPQVAGCSVSHDGIVLGAFSSVSACPAILSEFSSGGVTPVLTDFDKPTKFTLNNLKSGYYKITFFGAEAYTSGGNTSGRFAINDGVTTSPMGYATNTTSVSVGMNFSAAFYYSSFQSSKTFELFGADDLSPIQMLSTTTSAMNVMVEYYPTDSETAVSTEQASWFIDANIGGANISTGGSNSAYSEITDPNLNMVINSNIGSSEAEIPCSSTNPSTGLTCAVGSESVGVSFIPKLTGRHRVCFSFNPYYNGSGAVAVEQVFQVVKTPNNAQTILEEGGERIESFVSINNTGTGSGQKVCGNFNISDLSKQTFRLMEEQETTVGFQIKADRSASLGQRDIHVSVENLSYGQNRPILTGDQVTTPGLINPKFFAFVVTSAGVVSRDFGDLINGNCTVTATSTFTCPFNSSKVTVTPICIASNQKPGTTVIATHPTNTTASQAQFIGYNPATGAATADDFQAYCFGY